MPDLDQVMDQVADAMAEASATAIEPRFAALAERDVFSKAAGELVTIADLEAERILTGRLQELLPGVPVVGEESCSADPTRLTLLTSHRCWVVDPVDGTANFVAGSPDWAVMVAPVEPTATLASWIVQPMHGRRYRAERGAGATVNGAPLTRTPADPDRPRRGVVMTKFLDAATRAHVEAASRDSCAVTAGSGAAGIEYPAVVDGDQDFIAFWRTRPWDHAPGALLVEEAGGHVAQHDGEPYHASRRHPGLIAAADPRTWQTARDLLGPSPSGVVPSSADDPTRHPPRSDPGPFIAVRSVQEPGSSSRLGLTGETASVKSGFRTGHGHGNSLVLRAPATEAATLRDTVRAGRLDPVGQEVQRPASVRRSRHGRRWSAARGCR